jgi:hypothetical protein
MSYADLIQISVPESTFNEHPHLEGPLTSDFLLNAKCIVSKDENYAIFFDPKIGYFFMVHVSIKIVKF